MNAKKSVSGIDPTPLLAAIGALDITITELRTAADQAQGKARRQVEEAVATAVGLRRDLEKRLRKAGEDVATAPEHALNSGLTVAGDATRRYEQLADHGTKVVEQLLETPVARTVAGQVDDAARLVESVRSAADKAVESLLSLTGLASRAAQPTAPAGEVEHRPAVSRETLTEQGDDAEPIRPKRPSRSSVKAAAARRVAGEPATQAAPETTAATTRRAATKKTTSAPATRRTTTKRTTTVADVDAAAAQTPAAAKRTTTRRTTTKASGDAAAPTATGTSKRAAKKATKAATATQAAQATTSPEVTATPADVAAVVEQHAHETPAASASTPEGPTA